MTSTEELSELLAILYAAPLEPEKWQVFLDRLSALIEISSGYMVSICPEEGNVLLAGGGLNFNPEVFQLYNQHYGANDPYTRPAMLNSRATIIQGDEMVSHSDLRRSEIYNDLLRRYDLEYMTLMSCDRSIEDAAYFFPLWSSPRHGPMDAASIHLLQTLIPHVQTALRLRTKLAVANTANLFSETALDAMSIAAFLVTSTGHVRHMNQLAVAHIQRNDGLRLNSSRLSATDLRENAQMEFLIARAAGGRRNGSDAMPGGAMKISRRDSQRALQVTIIPTPDSLSAVTAIPCALVFVHDPSALPRSRAAFMKQLYGLTPTEARLADLLLEGLEVRDIANRLTMTLETARFHLKRVLAKTGTRRQTELMRLMLSLPGAQ
jgi:DNA-binding CsgD family transcriptional regulator/PAS domain-containing protein